MERSTHTLAMKSQKAILEALLELIKIKPYEDINISQLCKKAEIDRRTFYRNFKDKSDVLFMYFTNLQEEYIDMLKQITDHSFYSLANMSFVFWTQHIIFLKTALYDQTLHTIVFQLLNHFTLAIYVDGNDYIPKQLQYNVSFIIGGLHNVLLLWISTGYKETAEELATMLSSMFKESTFYWPNSK